MKAKLNKVAQAIRSLNFFDMGEALGFESVVSEQQFREVLRCCKSPRDRNDVRDGYIAARQAAGASYEAARRKFYREAKLYAPESSNRQKKANAKKAAAKQAEADAVVGGNDGGKAHKLSEKTMARNITAATRFIATWQDAAMGQADTLDRLGKLLQVLNAQ